MGAWDSNTKGVKKKIRAKKSEELKVEYISHMLMSHLLMVMDQLK